MSTPTPRRAMGSPLPTLVPPSAMVTPTPRPAVNSYLPAQTTSAVLVEAAPLGWDGQLKAPDKIPLTSIPEAEARQILLDVHSASIQTLSLKEIATLGGGPETALNESLAVFLDRIDKADMPQLFKMVTELDQAVKAEDLDGVVAEIMDARPSAAVRLMGYFSEGKLKKAKADAIERLNLVLSGKSQKLSTMMKAKEKELRAEAAKALEEVDALEAQKLNYRKHFTKMLGSVIFLTTLLAKAQGEVAQIKHATKAGTYDGEIPLQEAEDKLDALESRALAVEGLLTKLPGDQMLTTQIQTVLMQTIQEYSTTVIGSFIEINGILLQIHGGLRAQNLQQGMQANQHLADNLAATRAKLTNQVATVAANAPGDNRLQQAQRVKLMADNINQLLEIKDKAKEANRQKFAESREILSAARTELTRQGAVIRPDLSVSR